MTEDQNIIAIRPTHAPPRLILPTGNLFAGRAERFEALAQGHSLGDWLRHLAALSRVQHEALRQLPDLPLPDAEALARHRAHRMPLLGAQTWPRPIAWRAILRQIAGTLAPQLAEPGRGQLLRLRDLGDQALEALAERVLHTELFGPETAVLPYVGAALQVLWTGLVCRAGPAIQALDVAGVCPACGFLPVASIVRSAGEGDGRVDNLRYLHCALCNLEWNLVRVKCAACEDVAKVAYRQLEGEGLPQAAAVRAETCDACHSYLKILYTENGAVDPVADDLATLALDILVDQAGYARAGPNLLLAPGEETAGIR